MHTRLIKCSLTIMTSCLLFCSFVSHAMGTGDASPPSVETFFKNPKIFDVKLSPDGSSIAMRISNADNRIMLVGMNIGDNTPKIIAFSKDVDIGSFHWVNNNRLVYDLYDNQVGVGDEHLAPGLFAVNKDGTLRRQLVERSTSFLVGHDVRPLLPWNTFFYDLTRGTNSDDIYVVQYQGLGQYRGRRSNLLRLNTITGRTSSVQQPGDVSNWLIDKNGEPRFAVTNEKTNETVHYKDPETKQWRALAEFPHFSNQGFTPFFMGPDGDFLVLASKGKNTRSIYRYDITSNKLDAEPLVSLKGYDFSGSAIYNQEQKKILGIRYETDAVSIAWLDPEMKAVQKQLDEQLPGTINLINIAEEKKSDTALVYSYSDRLPGIWYLYNMRTGELNKIGNTRPDIQPSQMARVSMIRYHARDGLEIPAYLTLPKGDAKNLPMVVMVHGGPYVRGGHWHWNEETQFLASRGYAVLEPDYRGSTGYGSKLFSAGWKQWGLAMQDDVADGAKWAIQQGYADPKRICIAGASYGGYATLMGLIKDPDIFKCGIDWVGVTDINLLYDVAWSDASEEWQTYGEPLLVGDQIKDAEQLKTTSPLLNASRLKQPLLMAYGGSDRRVPIVHGTKFYNAAKATNDKVEWVEYPEEGHGFHVLKNQVDFWTRVEKFLDKNIGARAL